MFKWLEKKDQSGNTKEQHEPNLNSSRFDDMENDLQGENPERAKEANGSRYIVSPIVEEQSVQFKGEKVYPETDKPSVFSSGRSFTRQIGELQKKDEKVEERIKGMPVVPKSKNNSNDYLRGNIREEEVKEAVDLSNHVDSNYQVRTVREIPEAPISENTKKTAHGYLVSVVMNEEQFSEYCKGNKNVLKVFPVLAEAPEKAAELMEAKGMIPIEVFDYNFFKAQVERVEQLAREHNIVLIRK